MQKTERPCECVRNLRNCPLCQKKHETRMRALKSMETHTCSTSETRLNDGMHEYSIVVQKIIGTRTLAQTMENTTSDTRFHH